MSNTPPNSTTTPTNLDNCDREPIHIPGAIQPHGALLALDLSAELRIVHASENVESLLGPLTGKIFDLRLEQILDSEAAQIIRANATARSWSRLNPIAAKAPNGRRFEVIVHRPPNKNLLVVELEPTDLVPQGTYRDYGADTHQAMVRLQGADSLHDLFQTAAETIRWVTGYDRVMVYRFSEEGHGQVVAEDRVQSLESFLGLHYPASDIPAQARRLYILNWLRVIVDIDYKPSSLLGPHDSASGGAAATEEPLDLTYSTLRRVSPIHVEYLRNMGVRASMSVSLIQDGKLWGLIACHHYAPKFIPYSVRMTCELLGQMLSTLTQSWLRNEEAEVREKIGERQVRLTTRLNQAHYLAAALAEDPADLLELVGATGAAVLEDGRCTRIGAAPPEKSIRELAAFMATHKHELLVTSRLPTDHPEAPQLGTSGEAVGIIALGFQPIGENILLWCRPAVEKVVSWAGSPEKVYSEGPNGPRLSPRGSFKLWQETVKNQSESWSPAQVEAAREVRGAIGDVLIRKAHEADQTRDMLLGMVSHDLRNPLGAIHLAAQMLQMGEPEQARVTRATARIAASSDRMRRMIEQLLDYTRVQSNSLELLPVEIDLVVLCTQLAEEVEAAHPGSKIKTAFPEKCKFEGDPDRIAQVISNLLGNARHHGDPAHPIDFALRCTDEEVSVEIRNRGVPIPADRLATVFEPFKRAREAAQQQRTPTSTRSAGLGLGLFIVKQIVELHHGTIRLTSSEADGTVCVVTLPRQRGAQAATEAQ